MHYLRGLAEWMVSRGLTRLSELTDRHLDDYRDHVLALSCPAPRKRHLLNTVVLIHTYRDLLPGPCRLTTADPWNGASGDHLVPLPPVPRVNRTPRIAPATMEGLLAWSLRMLEDIGPDIAGAWRTYQHLRTGTHPSQADLAELPIRDRLAAFLTSATRHGGVLPGKRDGTGRLILDEYHLCRVLGLPASFRSLRSTLQRKMVTESRLPLVEGCPLDTPITGTLDGQPWRDRPLTAQELPDLVRVLTAALFVIVCYLSGLRPGEALNLRRGCRSVDTDTGHLLLVGRRGKGRGRAPLAETGLTDDALARPWVVVQPVHDAIALLEQLTTHDWLFPPAYDQDNRKQRTAAAYARTGHYIAQDIGAFVDWVNRTFAGPDDAPVIPADPAKRLHAARLRRTLAYFIVRRPRGLIAAALQYGHVATKVTLAYAGEADTSWMNDLAIERLELVVEQIGQDQALLHAGEHVSGPAAAEYRTRVDGGTGFGGRVLTGARNAERLLAHADPNIHHAQGMTCVWTKEAAACRKAALAIGLPDLDAPDDTQCRTTCLNLAYTDRDIHQLRDRLAVLGRHAGDLLAPQPLRDRAAVQAATVRSVIDQHERPQQETGTEQ